MANSIYIRLAFKETNETRQIIFDDLPDDALIPDTIKERINAINASLAAGTSDGLNTFFLSNDGKEFASITSAHSISEVETPITIPAS